MSTHDEHDDQALRGTSSGTGWAEDESSTSLSARLAHLDRLAAPAEGDDEDGGFVAFDELDEEPYDDEHDPDPLAVLATARGRAAPAVTISSVAATDEILPTSVPGVRATRRKARRRARAQRHRRVSLPLLALVVVTALATAFAASLWLDVRERTQAEDARRGGLEASRDAARLLFSYDYRTLDKNFAAGRELTTGSFRTDYDKTTTKVVADVAKRYKAVVTANVISAGIVSASPSTVVTVVYVNQVTTSTQVKGQKVDLSRVRMTLVRSGDVWLVTKVDAL